MAKGLYEIKDFSGGLNAYADPRDIKDNEFSQNWNIVVDKNGILRVVGSAVESINSKSILNNNIQTGFGLYQFGVDYSWNLVDGSFGFGFEQGTVAGIEGAGTGASGTTEIILEDTSTVSSTDDYYNGMTIFIYGGTNAGETRRISDYDGDSKKIQVTEAFDTGLATSSKYMIFRWQSYGFDTVRENADADTTHVEDFITDGESTNFPATSNLAQLNSYSYSSDSVYFAITKQSSITAGTSEELGYLQYNGAESSNLTLKSGVTYTLSFECAFKNKYYNDISDGSTNGSAVGTGDSLPNIELYSATVTNGTANQEVTNTGLSLQSNNRWLLKGLQSDYIHSTKSYANYIDNGDFRASGTPVWTEVGVSATTFTTTYDVGTSTGSYNGSDGTLKMGGINGFVDSESSYIQMSLTLDTFTHYSLNFQYKGDGLRYAVYDSTDSKYLINWTSDGTPSTHDGAESFSDSNYKWQFPFQQGIGAETSTNYVDFYVDKEAGGTAATKTIHIRFSPFNYHYDTFLHGVTCYKARNDLVTMGFNKKSNNPFVGTTNMWSRYSTKFKIPSDYNDANDWVFRVRGGRYSCGHGTYPDGVSAVNNQEVYINDIKINGDDGDVITILTSIEESYTKFALNSSNQGNTWNQGFIEWGETKGRPNFNYANGMLRISDGNFSTNNPNILMFYDAVAENNVTNYRESSGWKIREGFIFSPPSIKANSHEIGYSPIYSAFPYDATDYQNEIFGGMTFTTPGGDVEASIETNWRYDCFGEQSSFEAKGMGIITRYFSDQDKSISDIHNDVHGDKGYIANFDSFYLGDINDKTHVTTAGLASTTYNASNNDSSGSNSRNVYSQALWPVKCLMKSNDNGLTENNDISSFIVSNNLNASSISHINFEIEYEFQGCQRHNLEGGGGPGYFHLWSVIPWFKVSVGRIDGGVPTASLQQFVNGNNIWSDNSILSVISNEQNINFGKVQSEDGILFYQIIDNEVIWDNTNNLSLLSHEMPSDDTSEGQRIRFKAGFSGTFSFDKSGADAFNLESGDDFILTIKDYILGASEEDNRHPWGIDGNIERDIAENSWQVDDAANPTVYTSHHKHDQSNLYDSFANFSRFFVKKLEVFFYDDNYSFAANEEDSFSTDVTVSDGNNIELFLNFNSPNDDVIASGWAEREFQIAVTCEDIFGTESSFNIADHSILSVGVGKCPDVIFYMGRTWYDNSNIRKTKIYLKASDSDVWYLQWYIIHTGDSNNRLYSTTSGAYADGTDIGSNMKKWFLDRNNNKDFNEVNSYESESMVSQEDGLEGSKLTCRYKTSVIANNRLYVGNVKQGGVIYGDRMIKSPPNKYNILPSSNFIDVAINDGDEITALEYYKDKILQFKKMKVFIINTSGDYEFLEDTFDNVGVLGQYSVAKTPHGIVWANISGCYIYNGEKLINLIEGKIPTSSAYENPATSNNRWCASSTEGDCVVGYDKNKDTMLVNFTKGNVSPSTSITGGTYHFATQSWTLIRQVWSDVTVEAATGDMTNMITSKDGDILFYHISTDGGDITNGITTLRRWNHEANDNLSTKTATFTTKDITFGNINVRKKVYYIYITYRVRSNGVDSGCNVTASVNGSSSFNVPFSSTSKFAFGQSNSEDGTSCYSDESGTLTLNETDGLWKTAQLKASTPSQLNNISSMMLKFQGTVAYDFEINDISISYRVKRIK